MVALITFVLVYVCVPFLVYRIVLGIGDSHWVGMLAAVISVPAAIAGIEKGFRWYSNSRFRK